MNENMLRERLIFLGTFLKNPKEIGSITPSSKFLKKSMLKNVDFDKAKYIVEYGSGTGIFTKEILKNARKDSVVLGFEINKKFYRYLKNNLKDPRLIIINDSAENIKKYLGLYNISRIDYVLSSLPFSHLPSRKTDRIIRVTKEILIQSGKLILYRHLHAYSNNFNRHLKNYFSNISTNLVLLNIPPSFVCICQK